MAMDHDELRAALSNLRDNALEPAPKREVLAHVGGCVECAGALRRLERLSAFLQSTAAVGPWQTERMIARLAQRMEEAGGRLAFSRWAIPVLGTAVLALFVSIARQAPDDELFAGPDLVASEELDFLGERP